MMYISQAIYVVKENPATVNRGQKSGRVRGRDQLQHVAMLLGRTAWRHVGGLLVATTCILTYPGS